MAITDLSHRRKGQVLAIAPRSVIVRPRVLLIGGSGQLGTELQRQATDAWEIVAPSHSELDIGRVSLVRDTVATMRPDTIVNASAFHVVDLCETRFGDALSINAVAVSTLAKAASEVGARFVTLSTDYVFDGVTRSPYRETDVPCPLQCYGVSKVAGELAAFSAYAEGTLVIRTCGLYGRAISRQKSGNFVLNRLAEARVRDEVNVGCDLICTPTAAADLAEGIIALLHERVPPGRYHLTNEGACDWAAFTSRIYHAANLGTAVVPTDRGGRYGPARRPAYSVLNCDKAASYGVALRPWEEAIDHYVSTLSDD